MDWDAIKKLALEKGAPLVGAALGGPGGAAVAGLLASLFGADQDNAADLARKIAGDPEAAVKLRQFELNHKVRLEEIALANVQGARTREVEVTRATGRINWPMYILAAIIVIGFFGLIGLLMWRAVPQANNDVAFMLFGALSVSFGAVVNYFFGSSKGSAEKTALLSRRPQ